MMRRLAAGMSVTLICAAQCAHAYSVKTYEARGASRIEACSTATKNAESATDERTHGRLKSVGACQCSREDDPKVSGAWRCLVQAIHVN
ncbi:hypothetical protein LMG27952_02900 [Paraburkholderia hiiakae]|uniref:Secreted protein n=1 Tax=Paraburkholderia hiiakae TaxID=1081782 RepID=A0ABM8NN07_9BURK|nr:hypothetical protein LMG27952_02900 [Paraburkholderia hiiakae]